MDVFRRAALSVLALVRAVRHTRVFWLADSRIPASRRLQSGISNASIRDRHRPGNFVSARDPA